MSSTPSQVIEQDAAPVPMFVQPTSTPSRRPRRATSSPPADDPSPSPVVDVSDGAGDFPDSLGGDDAAPTTETGGSSRASTDGPVPRLIDANTRRAYAQIIRTVASAVSGLVSARLSPEDGAFLMHPDEADAIAAPASRILARRAPLPTGAGGATDAADVVEMVTAFIGYALASVGRRAAAGYDDAPDVPQDTGPAPVDPGPAVAAPAPSWPSPPPAPPVGLGL